MASPLQYGAATLRVLSQPVIGGRSPCADSSREASIGNGPSQGALAMNARTALLGLLLSGFFAVACIRASVPASPSTGVPSMNLLRFPGRIERIRRSRWQWIAMVSLMIVLRLQQQLPLILEVTAALQFLLFLALPTRAEGKGDAAAV
jgi:hypothetical protein